MMSDNGFLQQGYTLYDPEQDKFIDGKVVFLDRTRNCCLTSWHNEPATVWPSYDSLVEIFFKYKCVYKVDNGGLPEVEDKIKERWIVVFIYFGWVNEDTAPERVGFHTDFGNHAIPLKEIL